jgi:hypothetical protein
MHICIDKPCLEWTLASYKHCDCHPLELSQQKAKTHVSDRHSRLPASLHRRGSSQSEQSASWSKLCFVLLPRSVLVRLPTGGRNLTRTPRRIFARPETSPLHLLLRGLLLRLLVANTINLRAV